MRELPVRKRLRLKDYDYSKNGMYFVTICTKYQAYLFGEFDKAEADEVLKPVRDDVLIVPPTQYSVVPKQPRLRLSPIGAAVNRIIENLPNERNDIIIDNFIIMPNHLHLLIVIKRDDVQGKRDDVDIVPYNRERYGVSDFVRTLKILTTKQIGYSPWHRSFHDHIIRDLNDYNNISEYIENNPANWVRDRFFEG